MPMQINMNQMLALRIDEHLTSHVPRLNLEFLAIDANTCICVGGMTYDPNSPILLLYDMSKVIKKSLKLSIQA